MGKVKEFFRQKKTGKLLTTEPYSFKMEKEVHSSLIHAIFYGGWYIFLHDRSVKLYFYPRVLAGAPEKVEHLGGR